MKKVHVECLPDERLVRKLGVTKKAVFHYTGKSRVFNQLKKTSNELAMVDEDPGSAKTTYEKQLKLVEREHGIAKYIDKAGNKIHILEGKLEDWILNQCRMSNINPSAFGLSNNPNRLHSEINQKLPAFERLIDELLEKNNAGIIKLKSCLQ